MNTGAEINSRTKRKTTATLHDDLYMREGQHLTIKQNTGTNDTIRFSGKTIRASR